MKFPEYYKLGSNFRMQLIKDYEFDDDYPPEGGLVMWEPPRKGFTYTIGVDPSWGIGEDRTAIHVLRNGTINATDAQVAEFCSADMNSHEVVPICYMLGQLYKDEIEDLEALMVIETNISDVIVHKLRMDFNYTNQYIRKRFDNVTKAWTNQLGWRTDLRTRPAIIGKGVHYIKNGWWDIASPWLINELQTIEKRKDDTLVRERVEAAKGSHDDLAMAGFIALHAAHELEFNEVSGTVEEVAKQRDRRRSAMFEAFDEGPKVPVAKRRDYINTACSAADASSWINLEELDKYYKENE